MNTAWESELAGFLTELLAVQEETLEVFTKKRELLRKSDTDGLQELVAKEQEIVDRLQQCLDRREQLLGEARKEGLPAKSIQALTQALPRQQQRQLRPNLKLAASRMRLLQHQSITNWVIAQRTLLHLSRLLEIIATGGRMQPTYGNAELAAANGTIVDQAI